MPEGQFLGQKDSYVYTSDNGTQFAIQRDRSLILGASTGLSLYDASAPFAFPLPRRFKPRGVYWEGNLDTRVVRKFIICWTLDSTLYATDSSVALTIDGVPGRTSGKRGEQTNFVKRSNTVPNP